MTTAEAMEKIKREFIEGYHEWLRDEAEMPEDEYGRKYGYLKSADIRHEDTFDSFKVYLDYFFGGRWLPGWERQGYPKEVIWELKNEGFLSYKEYTNWNARARGKTDWFYINRKVARAIYKESKAA